MKYDGLDKRHRQFMLVMDLLKDEIIKCTDSQLKQYILYFLCNRANLWGVKDGALYDMIGEVMKSEDSKHGCTLTLDQYKSALKGYTDNRKISNRRFAEKTGIKMYGNDSFTAREFEQELLALSKFNDHVKRVELLKRLVRRKKNVSVDDVLKHFNKHNVGISRTKYYNTVEYKVIMSEFFLDGTAKVKKMKDRYLTRIIN